MSNWLIQRRGRVRTMDEDLLRQRLRRGRITGAELARREEDRDWRPIFELPIYKEEVPLGRDPIWESQRRLIVPMIMHCVAFAMVLGPHHEPPPIWAIPWAVFLFTHVLRTMMSVRELRNLRRLPREPERPSLPEPERQPQKQPDPPRSAWRARIDEALAGLAAAAKKAGREAALPDLDALGQDIDALDRTSSELGALSSPELRQRLQDELSETERQAASASDARTAEALRGAAAAIRARLLSADEAAEASSRLSARQAALLHQIEGLRLSLATASLDDHGGPDLSEQVRELRARADAKSELDRQLAAARQAQLRVPSR